ncbi:MAG: TetR/AcrR family transcriptional regulator [Clostridiales bacterium]|nr:TetR/AcrR family transcriptional regulator [Clostridiales bacterium]
MKRFPGRKDNIILAAIEIISEDGIHGLSTKKIAARQGISESLLYKHFNSINDVLVAVVKSFSRYDMMIINTVRKRDITYKEKIIAYIGPIVELYQNYPSLASIMLNYETLLNYRHTRQLIKGIINTRKGFVKSVIEKAQAEGEMNNNLTSQELADIINGVISDMVLRWKISGYVFNLKEDVLATIGKVLDLV